MLVIGPKPLVEEICEIAQEFQELELKTLIYQTVEESAALIDHHTEPADIYMFAGPTPYHISKGTIPHDSLAYYVPFEGSDIYRVLLNIYKHYNHFPDISFDIVEANDLKEIYEEMNITNKTYYLKSSTLEMERSGALLDYHITLLKDNKIQVIATTINSVYEGLKEIQAPVFLINHTKATIRHTLRKAVLKGYERKKEEAQITALRFQIMNIAGKESLLQEFTAIKESIQAYGNRFFSSSVLMEENTITLYTTYGVLDRVTRKKKDFTFLQQLNDSFSIGINLGIGIGSTAESASYNAKNALEFASRKTDGGCCFLIDEQKRIHGPLGTRQSMEYNLLNHDNHYRSLSLRKFYAWLSMMQKKKLTTREVGIGMNTTERHAARILKNLSEEKIAAIIGKELIHQKGRPRLVYEINIEKLAHYVNEKKEEPFV
ncbi:hypothetical protein [Peribacillus kribbensis]|uniref:hypothetical protein n=1 Tax=Peribacillus kribbensis TaxID=356658 RepID=UPI00041AE7EF|nr:hypothetical protein [Peribacillus kribbensis]